MTPTSTRAQAAILGLNSVYLYKQAESGGFMDTLKNYWGSRSDTEKGAIIGGGGGALIGGLTAPKGSALKRALLLGGLGAGAGGLVGHMGQEQPQAPSFAGRNLWKSDSMPGDKPLTFTESLLGRFEPMQAPAAVRWMGDKADQAIDAGKGVLDLTSRAERAMRGLPMEGATHGSSLEQSEADRYSLLKTLARKQRETNEQNAAALANKAPETSLGDVAAAGKASLQTAIQPAMDKVKDFFATKATPASINKAVDQFKGRWDAPSAAPAASPNATPASINKSVEQLMNKWTKPAAPAAPPSASNEAGSMFGAEPSAAGAGANWQGSNDWRSYPGA